eukprot:GABV01000130.1.p1 GENE.GABV01000130.1~~GABV01000130.1.p1  ORF type:complete len:380 (-),score=158.78 GABV01000130.1:744-1772(-)
MPTGIPGASPFGTMPGGSMPRPTEEEEEADVDMKTTENPLDAQKAPLEPSEERSIVLHEDKEYFVSADVLYPEAEVLVQDEDTQPIEQPIIAPVKSEVYQYMETTMPKTSFSFQFLTSLMDHPTLIRHIAVVGHIHHGKTSLLDTLVAETHPEHPAFAPTRPQQPRYTDARHDEHTRAISIKSTPLSLVLPTLRGKSHLLNLLDCPGHLQLTDESTAAMRLADGVLLCVDAAEGVMLHTRLLLEHALSTTDHALPIVVVLTKIDRLILELKLPPRDAYRKLEHVLAEINSILDRAAFGRGRVSPELGNVVFASGLFGFSFTLESFATMYAEYHAPKKGRKLG